MHYSSNHVPRGAVNNNNTHPPNTTPNTHQASILHTPAPPPTPPENAPPSPRTTLTTIITTLDTANAAGRKDLNWAAQQRALETALTMVEQQSTAVKPMLHALVLALAPAVDALRSQTARRALQLLTALLRMHPRHVEKEVEVFLPGVLRRAGEGATRGRETFLAGEADTVLCVLRDNAVHNGGCVRVMTALLGYAGHKNAAIRGCVAGHVAIMAEEGGVQALLAGGGAGHAVLTKLVATGVAFAEEGSADTRRDGKRVLVAVKRVVGVVGGPSLGALMSGLSETQQRRAAGLMVSIMGGG